MLQLSLVIPFFAVGAISGMGDKRLGEEQGSVLVEGAAAQTIKVGVVLVGLEVGKALLTRRRGPGSSL